MRPVRITSLAFVLLTLADAPHALAICAGMPQRLPPEKSIGGNSGYSNPLSKYPVPRSNKSSLLARVVSRSANNNSRSQDPRLKAMRGANAKAAEDIVPWLYGMEDAQRLSAEDSSPFAVYFCSESVAAAAGEGAAKRAELAKNNPDAVPPPTIFEQNALLGDFRTAGISNFVKLANTAQNKDLFEKLEAGNNTLLICAPNADVLVRFSGTDCHEKNVSEWLKTKCYDALADWKRKDGWRRNDIRRKKDEIVSQVIDQRLYNTFQFGPRVFSGARLWDDAGYEALKALGVSWIVAVGAGAPEEEHARRHGIGCVHVPIAFNAVPRQTALMLGRCIHDLSGGIYFCADNGKDRAPAAAAIASIVVGEFNPANAARALKQAGVPESLAGLYAAAAGTAKTTREEFFSFEAKFDPRASSTPLAQQMNELQLTWDKILLAQQQDWQIPADWKAVDPPADAQAVLALHKTIAGLEQTKASSDYFRKLLWENETAMANVAAALKDWQRGVKPKDVEGLDVAVERVSQSCAACHAQFRDAEKRQAVKP